MNGLEFLRPSLGAPHLPRSHNCKFTMMDATNNLLYNHHYHQLSLEGWRAKSYFLTKHYLFTLLVSTDSDLRHRHVHFTVYVRHQHPKILVFIFRRFPLDSRHGHRHRSRCTTSVPYMRAATFSPLPYCCLFVPIDCVEASRCASGKKPDA